MAHGTRPTRSEAPFEPGAGRERRDEIAAAPRARDWRETVMTASGMNVVAGIWLIVAPWILAYGNGDPYWNDVAFGALVALIGLVRAGGAFRESGLSLVNAAIGVWLFASAFWLDATARAGWNDVVLGIVVFVLALLSAGASEDAGIADARPPRR